MSAAELIAQVRRMLGPNGEHWIKGSYFDADGGYCVGGAAARAAVEAGAPAAAYRDAVRALYMATGYRLSAWNDDPARAWPEIDAALAFAQEIAPAAERELMPIGG